MPPGSKSLTNRALLLAALAEGTSRIDNVLVADDSRAMVDCLAALGVAIELDAASRTASVQGCGGDWPADEARLDCGAAGTVARFLAAAATLGSGFYTLDGSARLRERPIEPLVSALRALGASILDDRLPLRIAARGLSGGTAWFEHAESSQFISALLMAAPRARGDVFIELEGPLVSRPFVRMTLAFMERFGVSALDQQMRKFIVAGSQRYVATSLEIEPDATAASYFLAAAAVTGGRVSLPGLGKASLQGDVDFCRTLESMGCCVERSTDSLALSGPPVGSLRGIDADLCDMPDVAQTLAVVALFATGPTRIRGVSNLRVKETDRLAALAAELTKLGASVRVHADGLEIEPPARPVGAAIDTYGDHRMAMSFAVAGLRVPNMVIRDAECVGKTYPGFFADWERIA